MNTTSSITTLDSLIEDFQRRLRKGEHVSISSIAAQHPDLANEIMELFPTIETMEDLKAQKEQNGTANPPHKLAKLTRLGEYRILGEIGRGGMGIVYEAVQESLHRHVAIKILPWLSPANDTLRKRFEREAKIAAGLQYPHIIPIYGFGQQEGIFYYAMQYIRGISLAELISFIGNQQGQELADLFRSVEKETAAFPTQCTFLKKVTARYLQAKNTAKEQSDSALPAEALPTKGQEKLKYLYTQIPPVYYKEVALLISQAANALQYAHEQKAIHRDIKPANLLLDSQGIGWIADFGLAKGLDSENVTAAGELLGTMRYFAPEFFEGISDERSDIYSLGLTLSELLMLQPAFSTQGGKLVQDIISGKMTRPRTKNGYVPKELERIVQKAVMTDPKTRYQSAREMEHDLKLFLQGRGQDLAVKKKTTPPFPTAPPQKKSFWKFILTTLVLFALAAFLYSHFRPVDNEIDKISHKTPDKTEPTEPLMPAPPSRPAIEYPPPETEQTELAVPEPPFPPPIEQEEQTASRDSRQRPDSALPPPPPPPPPRLHRPGEQPGGRPPLPPPRSSLPRAH